MDAYSSISGGWTRTNTFPDSAGRSTFELHRNSQQPVLVSNQLDRGSEPQSPPRAWPTRNIIEPRASGGTRTHASRLTRAAGRSAAHRLCSGPERMGTGSESWRWLSPILFRPSKHPREELNLLCHLRRVAPFPLDHGDIYCSQKESNLHFHLRRMAPCPLDHGSLNPVEPRGVEPLTPCLQGTGLTRQ